MKYVISVDQSTQGTKGLVFDATGRLLSRADLPHRQLVNDQGWVSHDPEEILSNLLRVIPMALDQAGVSPADVACMGISNQRETTVAWDAETGKPVCPAIVWQCSRATGICRRLEETGIGDMVRDRTGIPLSPYFPASKMAWILEEVPEARTLAENGRLRMGTVDAWLVFRLTGQFRTDYSNASRTQLFNIHTLAWDADICRAFGIPLNCLPAVTDSDAVFGNTDLGGYLPGSIPVCGVLGDSHAALFGQGCLKPGMTKATYGTGSSIMMQIGEKPVSSRSGLVCSLAWKRNGRVDYVMEGNLNYTGAVITWLKDQLGLIASARETEALACAAHPSDTTVLVPAFTGLGAPYWVSDARAMICGMTRLTGKAEIVRAALDCIAFQIRDVVRAMETDTGISVPVLRADGGPAGNGYLMQFQSDILGSEVAVPNAEELSGIGAAYMAGLSAGILDDAVFSLLAYTSHVPSMDEARRESLVRHWKQAVDMVSRSTPAV